MTRSLRSFGCPVAIGACKTPQTSGPGAARRNPRANEKPFRAVPVPFSEAAIERPCWRLGARGASTERDTTANADGEERWGNAILERLDAESKPLHPVHFSLSSVSELSHCFHLLLGACLSWRASLVPALIARRVPAADVWTGKFLSTDLPTQPPGIASCKNDSTGISRSTSHCRRPRTNPQFWLILNPRRENPGIKVLPSAAA